MRTPRSIFLQSCAAARGTPATGRRAAPFSTRPVECLRTYPATVPGIDGTPSQVRSASRRYYPPRVRATPHRSRSIAFHTIMVAVCIAVLSAAAAVWMLRAQRSEPPSLDDSSAWQWVTTSPGINVYVHQLSGQRSTNYIRVWVAFRAFDSPVSVNADMIELWEFDCIRRLSRRLTGPFRGSRSSEIAPSAEEGSGTPWRRHAADTVPGRILSLICAAVNPNQSSAAAPAPVSTATLRQSACHRDPCRPS